MNLDGAQRVLDAIRLDGESYLDALSRIEKKRPLTRRERQAGHVIIASFSESFGAAIRGFGADRPAGPRRRGRGPVALGAIWGLSTGVLAYALGWTLTLAGWPTPETAVVAAGFGLAWASAWPSVMRSFLRWQRRKAGWS